MSQPNRLQYILAIIVAITWLGVTFIPFFSPNENDVRMAVGVQAAIMTADFMRGIMVSAAALIVGFSLASTALMSMGRRLGKVYNVPDWVRFLFLIGYNILLVSVIVGRWNSIGEPMTIASVIAFAGLTLNVISVLAYSWFVKEVK
jgi:hypothetical protein